MEGKKNFEITTFLILFYLFVFQDLIQSIIPLFKYFDELYILIGLCIAVVVFFKREEIVKVNKFYIVGGAIFVFFGILSSIVNHYQSIFVSISDLFLNLKFLIGMYLGKVFFSNINEAEFKTKVSKHAKIIIIVFFVGTILNYLFGWSTGEIRYGIRTNNLFYSHPTILVMNMIFVLSVYIYSQCNIKFDKYILMSMVIIASTLRSKAFAIVALILVLYYLVLIKNRKITLLGLIVLGFLGVIVAFPQIQKHFIEHPDYARSKLLTTSFQIAEDYFPLGTGFGTYGSHLSTVNYSEVYYKYGLNKVYGLTEKFNSFASDNFWPMIIGQVGVFGFIGYALIHLTLLTKILFKIGDKRKYLVSLLMYSYLLISSTSESAFVHYSAIPLSLFLGIILANSDLKNIKKKILEGELECKN